jgi:uncharacterized protein (DUF58 family)
VLSERTLRGLTVRRIGAEAAFAREPFTYRWALTAGRRAAWALTVGERSQDLQGAGTLAYLPAGEERIVRGALLADRRGPLALDELTITTTFPLGLFAKSRSYFAQDTVLVFPRRGVREATIPEGDHGPVGSAPDPRRTDGQGEPAGLRPLRDGESARGIHWLKSAARGVLVKVEREREEQQAFELVLSAVQGPALDRECEKVAALATRLIAEGHEVGLTAPGRQLRPGAGPRQLSRVLQALAWAGFEEEGRP